MKEGIPKILLAGKDAVVCRAFLEALSDAGYEVHLEEDLNQVETAISIFQPDLVVLEVTPSPGPDGIELGRIVHRVGGDIPVMFLSDADATHHRLPGFESATDDYLTKPFSMSEFLARVQVLLHRRGYTTDSVHWVQDVLVDERVGTVTRAGSVVNLTPIEYDLFSMLARHAGKVVSKPQILSEIWGYTAWNTNVVEAHISSLRRKLERHGPRIVHTVRGSGYVIRR